VALADTGKAIGAVSQLLRDRLLARLAGTVGNVRIGKPEMSGEGITNPRLNLFLYEIQLDPHLRNRSLDPGQSTPLWLVLKYLLTAFDEAGDSDSIESHSYLGEAMRVLQELSFLPLNSLPSDVFKALDPNPEALKITFDSTSSELISKLMQGPDEKYRCSVGFEVRPVMIATGESSSYSLLVGVDYVNDTIIGAKGIQIPVLPSMGPKIDAISPTKISLPLPPELSILTIRGNNLNLSNLTVLLGSVELQIVAKSPDILKCELNGNIRNGSAISAGTHPVCVVEILPNGKTRSSNLLVASLLPVVTGAAFSLGNLNLEGFLLGTASDDVFVALYQNGKTVRVFDEFVEIAPAPPAQTQLRVQITDTLPGIYRVILRVNGQQAQNSPEVTIT
jgi:Pvc16 N-terminal domain